VSTGGTGAAKAWPGYERGDPGYRRIVLALFAAGFATFTQVFGAQAVLPAVGVDLGISSATAALLVSATTIGVAISVLPWASVADRIGRVTAMKISIICSTVLDLAVPFVPGFEGVVVLRFAMGLALGAVPAVAMAYLAEELRPRWVAVAAGTYIAGNSIGGIVARLMAGTLSQTVGWRVALFVVAAVGALSAVAFLVSAPRPCGFIRQAATHSVVTRILFHLRDPVMVALFVQGFVVMGVFSVVYNYLGFHLIGAPFDVPETLVSLLFLAYLAGTVSSRASGSLVHRFGALRIVLVGLALMIAGCALMLASSVLPVVVGLVVFTTGCFTAHPVASGMSGQLAQIGRAQATATYQLSWLTGSALLGWAVGLLYDGSGWTAAILTVMCLVAAAAVVAVIGLGLLRNHRPRPSA
jgi:predicted MFS family arabinose efflux permease